MKTMESELFTLEICAGAGRKFGCCWHRHHRPCRRRVGLLTCDYFHVRGFYGSPE